MEPIALARLLASHLEENQRTLAIDADVHATDIAALEGARRERYLKANGYYHGRPISAEDILAELGMAEVDMALIWQNPSSTPYTSDQDANAEALLAANRYVLDAALAHPMRFIPAGWTDPKACGLENALRLAATFVREFGFPIVKMNPAQNRFPIDSPEAMAVVDRIVELGAVPAFHFGADTPYTPAEGLRRVAERHPRTPVLAVHMGGGGAGYEAAENLYQQARALGLERPNIRYVLSGKRDTHTESDLIAYQLAGSPFSENLFCGSDAPYGRIAWNFGGFRAMFSTLERGRPGDFTREAAQGYLGGNFARFAAAQYRRMLALRG
jgi:predicted TIM-barrel fold metal-dependent hydrolase